MLAAGKRDIEVPGTERPDELGNIARAVKIFRESAGNLERAHKAAEAAQLRANELAHRDMLTGLPNRRVFAEAIAKALARVHQRHSGCAILLIDLDHFKSINDRFGHALGDRVLEIFTDAARQSVRTSDLIGRLGGEEFAAVLYDTDPANAMEVAERIRDSFAKLSQDVDGRPVCATVSIGLVHSEAAVLDVPELLAQADQALYYAKERGRNRIEIASLDMLLERKNDEPNGVQRSATSLAAIAAKSAA